MSEGFDYRRMVLEASTHVVREVLSLVAAEGMRGEHHFFLTFSTRYPGVELPAALRLQFPETMTIVLQNQFWDLEVEDESFVVTLRFAGALERLRVPYLALTTFIDPSVPFGLDLTPFGGGQLEPPGAAQDERERPDNETGEDLESGPDESPEPPGAAPGGGAVVPFRRR